MVAGLDWRVWACAWLAVAGCAPALAQAPAPYDATPELVAAARAEGEVTLYTSLDVEVLGKIGASFEARYPGVKFRAERSGSERIFQRINQEYSSAIHTPDVIETSDAVQFIVYKRQGWLAAVVPREVAETWPAEGRDADGRYAVFRANLSLIAYNTKLVKPEDAPKSHADLLDPKWIGRIVKAHPSYSGSNLTDAHALETALGWSYFEKLGQQRVMQVQSAADPPKKVAQGERPVMADGSEYNVLLLKAAGQPIEPVYATDGTTLAPGNAAVLEKAPHPNAARLLYHFMFTEEAQRWLVDVGDLRSFHPGLDAKPGRPSLSQIKLLRSDPAALDHDIEEIKRTYEKYFGT